MQYYLSFHCSKPHPMHKAEVLALTLPGPLRESQLGLITSFYKPLDLKANLQALGYTKYTMSYLCVLEPEHVMSNVCPSQDPYFYREKTDFYLISQDLKPDLQSLFHLPDGDIATLNVACDGASLSTALGHIYKLLTRFARANQGLFKSTQSAFSQALKKA